jgi:hypothetical protein
MEAPLSSPSLKQPSQYFHHNSQQRQHSTQAPAAPSTMSSAPQQQQQQGQLSSSQDTSPFLRDFNLVAEAAKRAQMAVLMREMEAVGL